MFVQFFMRCAILLLTLFAASCFAQVTPKSVTVPVTLDHNRIIIDVYLPLADGTQKRVRAWVDTGNVDLWMDERVAKFLGLVYTGESQGEILGAKVRPAQPPHDVTVAGMKISFEGVKESRVMASDSIAPGSSAEINLPSTVLRHYDLAMDYVNRELTLATPGQIKFTGASAKAFVNPSNGLIQVPAKIADQTYSLTLDLGACFSMLAGDVFQSLRKSHPAWPHMTGSVGNAIFWGMPGEATAESVLLPSIQYGSATIKNVGASELPAEFMKFYRERTGAETSGLIGGNALLNYKVGIDYAHATVYFDPLSKFEAPGMDVVGLTLRPEVDERYTVIGVPLFAGKPTVAGVKPGDILIAVDKVPAKGSTMGQIWSLLGGSPGDKRVLTLERDGKQFNVTAVVRRFLPIGHAPPPKGHRTH